MSHECGLPLLSQTIGFGGSKLTQNPLARGASDAADLGAAAVRRASTRTVIDAKKARMQPESAGTSQAEQQRFGEIVERDPVESCAEVTRP